MGHIEYPIDWVVQQLHVARLCLVPLFFLRIENTQHNKKTRLLLWKVVGVMKEDENEEGYTVGGDGVLQEKYLK